MVLVHRFVFRHAAGLSKNIYAWAGGDGFFGYRDQNADSDKNFHSYPNPDIHPYIDPFVILAL
jgi:hypothetical protein